MGPGDRLTINVPKVSHETIDGEVVIVNFENGNYYSLLGSAADIWSMLEGGASVGDLVEAVGRWYTGDRSHVETAIMRFVEDLRVEDLIVHENGQAAEQRAATGPGATEPRTAFETPVLNKYTDVQDLLVLDPIDDVDETGWPAPKTATGD